MGDRKAQRQSYGTRGPNYSFLEDDQQIDNESSEGEDWKDGNTLVEMFAEPVYVSTSIQLSHTYPSSAPQNDEDELLALVEGLKGSSYGS